MSHSGVILIWGFMNFSSNFCNSHHRWRIRRLPNTSVKKKVKHMFLWISAKMNCFSENVRDYNLLPGEYEESRQICTRKPTIAKRTKTEILAERVGTRILDIVAMETTAEEPPFIQNKKINTQVNLNSNGDLNSQPK